MIPKVLDLHMHSTVSDGSDSPEELLENVRRSGIELFALTDHDDISGCSVIRSELRDNDPGFISGVEFSCKDDNGKYHILGYGYDPDSDSIKDIVALGHKYRMDKAQARIDHLKNEFGIRLPEEEIKNFLELKNPGKPHLGNLLVKYGYAPDKEQAIRDILDKAHFKKQYIRPEEAIEGIIGASGIPVLAHPIYGSGDQLILADEMDQRLKRLISFGLKGVEVFYSGFTDKMRDQMIGFAEKYELYITAGSDYHGSNKLVVLGDTGISEDTVFPEGLIRFIKDVRR